MPLNALRTTLRQKLQTTLALLIVVVLGLSAVTLWATIQWRRSESELREHYLRSLLLLDVRATTFRALKELPDAAFAGDREARHQFDQFLEKVERDFARWVALAHNEVERLQVREVRESYDTLIEHARDFFKNMEEGKRTEALESLEDQIESKDLEQFERLSTEAVRSDEEYRARIERTSDGTRRLAQVSLATAASATLGLAGFLGYLFFVGLLGPLREVEKALGALGRGDLERRIPEPAGFEPVPVLSRNELAALTRAFNRTVDELSRTTVSKIYLDNVIESILDTVIVTTPDGRIRTANPAGASLLEIPREDLVGRDISEFIGQDWRGSPDGWRTQDRDTVVRTRSGRILHVSLSCSVMRGDGESNLGIAFVAKDVSERNRTEDQLRSALEEKEILFKEINHRVKNNLQIIQSLLNLHARQTMDSTAREILRDSQNRIQAMALVHDMLYRSEAPSQIDLAEYLRGLAVHLTASHGSAMHRIQVESDAGSHLTSLDTAIPCGLIINELVTNSLKHGFPDGAAGEIMIGLRRTPEGHYRVTVRDNGIGLPESAPLASATSLGLRLVHTLVEQLGGTLRQQNDCGARVEVEFPALFWVP